MGAESAELVATGLSADSVRELSEQTGVAARVQTPRESEAVCLGQSRVGRRLSLETIPGPIAAPCRAVSLLVSSCPASYTDLRLPLAIARLL